eukprot:1031149-Prymnesium_polylepis.1
MQLVQATFVRVCLHCFRRNICTTSHRRAVLRRLNGFRNASDHARQRTQPEMARKTGSEVMGISRGLIAGMDPEHRQRNVKNGMRGRQAWRSVGRARGSCPLAGRNVAEGWVDGGETRGVLSAEARSIRGISRVLNTIPGG